jgi:hypothetical protein
MATVARASFRDILTSVRTQLVNYVQLNENQIKVVAREDVPYWPSTQYLLLRPRSIVPQPGWNSGAGRVSTVVSRNLLVMVRTKLWTDVADQDAFWLSSDPTESHILLEEKVADALHEFFPTDTSGNHLTIQGLKLTPSPEPVKAPQEPSWGQTALEFSIFYQLNLNQAIQ